MPNVIYHCMIVEGESAQLDALYARLDPHPYETEPGRLRFNLFEAFRPQPVEYRETKSGWFRNDAGESVRYEYPELNEKYGANDWYEWTIQNWGTKWGTYDTHIVREGDRLILTFSTANSSPHAFYAEHLAGLTFRYRAHEESRERLIEGSNEGVTETTSPDAEERLLIWAIDSGRDMRQYVNRKFDEIDWFAMAEGWIAEIKHPPAGAL